MYISRGKNIYMMPYNTNSKQVKQLPTTAKKLFLKAYKTAFSKTKNEESSFKIAWTVVKKRYTKKKGTWSIKSETKIKTVINKSGFFNKSFFFQVPITTTNFDGDHKVNGKLLEMLHSQNLIDESGDIEHLSINGKTNSYNGLFKLKNHIYSDGKLIGNFIVDKTHKTYNYFKKNIADKIIGVSAEFIEPVVKGNEIIDAKRLGWTFTSNPDNEECKI